jgi:putative sigma-54 modulation protein
MKSVVRGLHLPLTEGLESYATKHLARPLSRVVHSAAAELDVVLCETAGPAQLECRVLLRIPHLKTLYLVERGNDLYRCISLARDRVERLAKREQERRRGPARRPAFLAAARARTL